MVLEVGVKKGDDGIWRVTLPGGRVREVSGEREELHLEVVEARNLPQMDVGVGTTDEERAAGIGTTCDGFCTVTLGDETRKTEVVRNTLHPKFDADFMFILQDVNDERGEVNRQLCDREQVTFVVQDWDEDGSADFVGKATVPLDELRKKDPRGRSLFCDKWIELTNEDGSPARPRPDGSPGRGLLHIRLAVRIGKQVEYLDRMNGRAWLEPQKVVEALEALPSHFQRGDRQVLNRVVWAIERRFFQMYPITSDDLQLTMESGIPLGTTLGRGTALSETKEPLGLQLKELVTRKIPIESFGTDDPRDVHFNVMQTHWLARQKAMVALAHLAFVKDEDALQAAMGACDDEHPAVRVEVIRVLKTLSGKGDDRVVKLLIARLEDDMKEVRDEAVSALKAIAKIDDDETVLPICSLFDSTREEVRQSALDALKVVTTRGNRQAVTELSVRLEAPSHSVRLGALAGLRAVASRGDKVGVVEVVNRLQHPVLHVRHCALQALSMVSDSGNLFALSAVGNLMEHPDPFVRQIALEAFLLLAERGQLGSIQVAALRVRVHTASDCVREGAKYVSCPTAGSSQVPSTVLGTISRSPSHAVANQTSTEDRSIAVEVLTPRLPDLMPISRASFVSSEVPLLPWNSAYDSIAHAWWAEKHASGSERHRYPFESTLHFTSMSNGSSLSLPSSPGKMSPKKATNDAANNPNETLASTKNNQVNRRASASFSRISSVLSRFESASSSLISTEPPMDLQDALKILIIGCEGLVSGPPDYPFPVYPKFVKAHKSALLQVPDLESKWDPHLLLPPRKVEARRVSMVRRSSEVARALGEYNEDEREVGRELTQMQPQVQYNAPRRENVERFLEALREEQRAIMDRTLHAADSKKIGTLTVVVESSANVPVDKLSRKCDSMVSLDFGSEKKGRTLVKLDTECPTWGAEFVLEVRQRHLKDAKEEHDGPRDLGEGNWADESDLKAFEKRAGTLGLFADFKLTLPLTPTELTPESSKMLLRAVASAAKRHRGDVEKVYEEQTGQRSRSFLLRVHTGDFHETVAVLECLNETSAAEALVSKNILDEYRGQLVSLVCFTPLSFLLEQSTPVKVTVQRFRLGSEADNVGFLEFPVAPVIATLRKGKPRVTRDFPVRDEDGQTVENEKGEECTLKVTLNWEDETFTFLSEGTEEASERARAMLASQVRHVGMVALQNVTGYNVEACVSEVGACGDIEVEEVEIAAASAIGAAGVCAHAAEVTGVSFVPTNKEGEVQVASCSRDGTVKLWSWESDSGVHVQTMNAGRGPVWGIAVGPCVGKGGAPDPASRSVLMAANDDASVTVWDPAVCQKMDMFHTANEPASKLVLAQNGKVLVTADRGIHPAGLLPGKDCGVHVWQVGGMPNLVEVTQEKTTRAEHEQLAQVFPLIERIVMIGGTASLAMEKLPGKISQKGKDLAQTALEKVYKQTTKDGTPEYDPWMRSLALRIRREVADGTFFLRGSMTPATRPKLVAKGTIALSIDVDPFEGNKIAVGSSDGSIRIWRSPDLVLPGVVPLSARRPGMGPAKATINAQAVMKAHVGGVRGLAFCGGRRDVLVSCSRTFKVWWLGAQDAICLAHMPSHTTSFSALAFSKFDPDIFCLGTTSGDVLSYQLSVDFVKTQSTDPSPPGSRRNSRDATPGSPIGRGSPPEQFSLGKSDSFHPSPATSLKHQTSSSKSNKQPSSLLNKQSSSLLSKQPSSLLSGQSSSIRSSTGSRSSLGSGPTSPDPKSPSSNLKPTAAVSKRGEQVTAFVKRNATRRLHFVPINALSLSASSIPTVSIGDTISCTDISFAATAGPLGAACSQDGSITVFDLMTCKAIRRLNGDPEPLGRRLGVSADALGELLQSGSAGARRVALRAMPMVSERGDEAALAAVSNALEKGGEILCETCWDLFLQLIVPGDHHALRRVAGLLQHSSEAVRETGRKAAFMMLEDAGEVQRVERMATKMRESKGTKAIETPLTIAAQMLVELGEEMEGMSEEEQARALRLWDASEDWGTKIAILAAIETSRDALRKGNIDALLKMVSHPLEAVRIIARELLGMVVFDGSGGSLVDHNHTWQYTETVEDLVAALMETCVGDDVGMAAEGCKAVSRVLSGAFARRTVEMQLQLAATREERSAEGRDRTKTPPHLAKGGYKGNKFTRK